MYSACEVILLDPEFADIRPHIGIANIFWSHMQMEGFIGTWSFVKGEQVGLTTMQAMFTIDLRSDELPAKDQRFLWIDYLCLRQCKADFTPNAVVELIRDIGCLAAWIDLKWEYVNRSFCII